MGVERVRGGFSRGRTRLVLERLKLVAPRRALPPRLLLARNRRGGRVVCRERAHHRPLVGQCGQPRECLCLAQRGERHGALLPEDARVLAAQEVHDRRPLRLPCAHELPSELRPDRPPPLLVA